jgi:hypothetical protein
MMGASLTLGRTVFFRPDRSFGSLTIEPSEPSCHLSEPGIHKEETHALAEALTQRIHVWKYLPTLGLF